MSQAISSFQCNLMKGTTSGSSTTWAQLIEIKDFPDLWGAPEPLDKTTLSDPMYTYIEGIKTNEQKSFTCNYNATDYATIAALAGTEQQVAIWFGAAESGGVYTPDGSLGKFKGKGYVNAYINGGGVNEVVNMTVTVTMTEGFVPDT